MMNQPPTERRARAEARPGTLRVLVGIILIWWHRHRSRAHLAELEARMLTDIGVSRKDARDEASKWFWQR